MSTKSLLSPDAALAAVLERTPAPRAERRALNAAMGLVLAGEVLFDRDYPPFNRAMMDGFGVCAEDAGRSVRLAGVAAAGKPWSGVVTPGSAVEIMTGAPCPPGVETVVPVEQVERQRDEVTLPEVLEPGRNIAAQGTEGTRGKVLLPAGTVVTPLAAAALASVGVHRPNVHPRPRVAVITTGDELVHQGETPAWYQMRDSNAPLLRALLLAIGVDELAFYHAADSVDSICAALASAREADIIVLTGGVSMGGHDLVPACCEAEGFQKVFHKVAQKPGKPLLFATRGHQLLFGLPGNPLAVHLCAHRYVAAALRAMSGRAPGPETAAGELTAPAAVRGDRTGFAFAVVAATPSGYALTPLEHVSSADVFTSPAAHALMRLEPDTEYRKGSAMAFEWLWGGIRP